MSKYAKAAVAALALLWVILEGNGFEIPENVKESAADLATWIAGIAAVYFIPNKQA